MIMDKSIFFFIGTEAEFIKLFPVILGARKFGIPYKIIASGQNDFSNGSLYKHISNGSVDLELSKESDIKKNAVGLLRWFLMTKRNAVHRVTECFKGTDFTSSIMVVHGDTVSTVMGSLIAKKLKMHVAHVEAGLRSHNIFNPFPEEIDRMITSTHTDIHFAPGLEPYNNLIHRKGLVIDTKYNTLLDSLKYSFKIPCMNTDVKSVLGTPYFVLVLHRQENLMNKKLVKEVISVVGNITRYIKCILILHKPTEIALRNYGLLDSVIQNENILTFPRVEYFDFMKLLDGAKYIITDGGSNQEELCYMGKPCLIMRTHTERKEGLGRNAIMYGGDLSMIGKFINCYERYVYEPIQTNISPTEIIVHTLVDCMNG